MKKIILPTDFSENSYQAIAYALALFKDETCMFYLLNTYTPVLYDSEYMYQVPTMSPDEIYKTNSQKGLQTIYKRIQKEHPNTNHEFKKIAAFNFLTDEVNELVEKEAIDLIIMGTKGATGAQEILFGSHTMHMIKKAHCPIIAVPSQYQFEPLHSILLLTDLVLGFKENQLAILRDIAHSQKSTLQIFHYLKENQLTAAQEDGRQLLANYFKNIDHKFYLKKGDSIQESVLAFKEENPVNLMCLVNNKHSFFENILFQPMVKKIGFSVKVPLLVIPSGKYSTRSIPVNLLR